MIFYQFSWSLFTINQAAKRAWRIGQTQECRLFYLAYQDTMQEHMAKIIAMKNKATAAINGEISSDGLSALLGDDGDLRSLLLKSVKEGKVLKGSAEEWISQTTDRAREILAGIGKKKTPAAKSLVEQFATWCKHEGVSAAITEYYQPLIQAIIRGEVEGFTAIDGVLTVDYEKAFGFEKAFLNSEMIEGYLLKHVPKEQKSVIQNTESSKSPILEKTSHFKQSKQMVKSEQEYENNIVVLKEVTVKNVSKKRSKATSKEQLVFDLFA